MLTRRGRRARARARASQTLAHPEEPGPDEPVLRIGTAGVDRAAGVLAPVIAMAAMPRNIAGTLLNFVGACTRFLPLLDRCCAKCAQRRTVADHRQVLSQRGYRKPAETRY